MAKLKKSQIVDEGKNTIKMSHVFAEQAKRVLESEEFLEAIDHVEVRGFWKRLGKIIADFGKWITGKKSRELYDRVAFLERSLQLAHYTNSLMAEKAVAIEAKNTSLESELQGIRNMYQPMFETYEQNMETKSPWVDTKDFSTFLEEHRGDVQMFSNTTQAINTKLDNIFTRLSSFDQVFEEQTTKIGELEEKLKKVDVIQITANTSNIVNKKMQEIQQILTSFKTFIENLRGEYATQTLLVTQESRRVAMELTDTKIYYNALRTFLVRQFGADAISNLSTIHVTVTDPKETKIIDKAQ